MVIDIVKGEPVKLRTNEEKPEPNPSPIVPVNSKKGFDSNLASFRDLDTIRLYTYSIYDSQEWLHPLKKLKLTTAQQLLTVLVLYGSFP